MSKRLAILGGGGFAKEVIEVAELCGFEIVGVYAQQSHIKGYPHRGYLEELRSQRKSFEFVALGVGAAKTEAMTIRRKLLQFLSQNGMRLASLVSPHAKICRGVQIGEGCFIAHGVVVSVDASLGDACVLNTGAIVGHDASICSNVIISPQVFIGGDAKIGSDCLIGASSSIKNGVVVGPNATVGMGAVVVRNVPDGALVLPQLPKMLRPTEEVVS